MTMDRRVFSAALSEAQSVRTISALTVSSRLTPMALCSLDRRRIGTIRPNPGVRPQFPRGVPGAANVILKASGTGEDRYWHEAEVLGAAAICFLRYLRRVRQPGGMPAIDPWLTLHVRLQLWPHFPLT